MKQIPRFKFRLYVVGQAVNSTQAIQNLTVFCQKHLEGRHEIEIVDVLCEPGRALADGVLLTPMLVRYSPAPARKILGNLSEEKPLLDML